jgi:hypothetical protein
MILYYRLSTVYDDNGHQVAVSELATYKLTTSLFQTPQHMDYKGTKYRPIMLTDAWNVVRRCDTRDQWTGGMKT